FDFLGGPLPVFLAEGKQGQRLDPRFHRAFNAFPHRRHPRLVPRRPGKAPPRRPAPVAVHDHGHVGGNSALPANPGEELLGGDAHTSMISASLAWMITSTCLMC